MRRLTREWGRVTQISRAGFALRCRSESRAAPGDPAPKSLHAGRSPKATSAPMYASLNNARPRRTRERASMTSGHVRACEREQSTRAELFTRQAGPKRASISQFPSRRCHNVPDETPGFHHPSRKGRASRRFPRRRQAAPLQDQGRDCSQSRDLAPPRQVGARHRRSDGQAHRRWRGAHRRDHHLAGAAHRILIRRGSAEGCHAAVSLDRLGPASRSAASGLELRTLSRAQSREAERASSRNLNLLRSERSRSIYKDPAR